MGKDEVMKTIRKHRSTLRGLGVKSLRLFGSVARDEAGPQSDVDLLIEFDKPVGLIGFLRVKGVLESVLGQSVDLVTPDAVRPELAVDIGDEALPAA